MKKILVTGAGAVLGQGIIKSLRSASFACEIVALDPNPLSVGLYWADKAVIIPMADDPSYSAAIENIMQREQPDAVLVGTDVELAIFANNRAAWEDRFNTKILVSNSEVIEIADDKYATVEFLKGNGLSFPESARADDREELERLVTEIGFPLIVKPRRGARAVGVSKVNDRDDLEQTISGRSDLVVQQMAGADDQEYTAGVLYFDDEVKASIVLRRDLRDGNTYRAYADDYPHCHEYVHAIAKALKPYGPANFQFRLDETGVPRLFEVNGRFSGTTPMRALVGFNEVDMCLRKLLFGEEITNPVTRKGVVLRFLEERFVEHADIAKIAQP